MDPLVEPQLAAWIAAVSGAALPSGGLGDTLKSGVVLCELLNAIRPKTVRRVSKSKMPFSQRENVKAFTDGARDLGVPDMENFGTEDLFEAKNLRQVQICLESLAAQLFELEGYDGPTFGKPRTKGHRTGHKAASGGGLWGKSGGAFGTTPDARKRQKSVVPAHKYQKAAVLNANFDASAALAAATPTNAYRQEYDGEPMEQALSWIAELTAYDLPSGGETLADDFFSGLQTGEVLCALANMIVPHSVPHIARVAHSHSAGSALSARVNIQAFVDAARDIGVLDRDLFEPNDLFERRNLPHVVRAILALGRACWEVDGYRGPAPVKRDTSRKKGSAKKFVVHQDALRGTDAHKDIERKRLAAKREAEAAQKREAWRPIFHAFDGKGDGVIDAAELVASLRDPIEESVAAAVLLRLASHTKATKGSPLLDFDGFYSTVVQNLGVAPSHSAAAARFANLATQVQAHQEEGQAASARKRELDEAHARKRIAMSDPNYAAQQALERALAGGTDDPGYVGAGGLSNSKREGGGMMGLAGAIASRRKRAGTTVSGTGTGVAEAAPAAAPVPSAVHHAHAGAVDVLGMLGGGGPSAPTKAVAASQPRARMRSSHGDDAHVHNDPRAQRAQGKQKRAPTRGRKGGRKKASAPSSGGLAPLATTAPLPTGLTAHTTSFTPALALVAPAPAPAPVARPHRQRYQTAFESLDSAHRGAIDADSIASKIGLGHDEAAELLQQGMAHHADSTVTYDDFEQTMQKLGMKDHAHLDTIAPALQGLEGQIVAERKARAAAESALAASNTNGAAHSAELEATQHQIADLAADVGATFPLSVLQQPTASLPPAVHPDRREDFLSSGDFVTVFGCDRAQWATVPKWKRTGMKKKAGLF